MIIKPLSSIICLTLLLSTTYAKWTHLNKEQLVTTADAIVIAHFESFRSSPDSPSFYNQLGTFHTIETLKGSLPKSFSVYGSNQHICAAYFSFQNLKASTPHLIFLSKQKYGWTDCNAFIQPIEQNQVLWFSNPDTYLKHKQFIISVKQQIHTILSKSPQPKTSP